MTRRGFGEMAITACMAAPIFNTLFGLGVPILIKLVKHRNDLPINGKQYVVYFSLYKDNDGINF